MNGIQVTPKSTLSAQEPEQSEKKKPKRVHFAEERDSIYLDVLDKRMQGSNRSEENASFFETVLSKLITIGKIILGTLFFPLGIYWLNQK